MWSQHLLRGITCDVTRTLRDITTNTCTRTRALIKHILTLTCLYNRDACRQADRCTLTAPQSKCWHVLHYVDPFVMKVIHRKPSNEDDIESITCSLPPLNNRATIQQRLISHKQTRFDWFSSSFVAYSSPLSRFSPSVSEPVCVLASVPLRNCSKWIHWKKHQEELPGNAPVHGEVPSDWSPGCSR